VHFSVQPVSGPVIVPKFVTGTICPSGGHRDFGVVDSVTTSGHVHSALAFSNTPMFPILRPAHYGVADTDLLLTD
jgi:hypothetical protein